MMIKNPSSSHIMEAIIAQDGMGNRQRPSFTMSSHHLENRIIGQVEMAQGNYQMRPQAPSQQFDP